MLLSSPYLVQELEKLGKSVADVREGSFSGKAHSSEEVSAQQLLVSKRRDAEL